MNRGRGSSLLEPRGDKQDQRAVVASSGDGDEESGMARILNLRSVVRAFVRQPAVWSYGAWSLE